MASIESMNTMSSGVIAALARLWVRSSAPLMIVTSSVESFPPKFLFTSCRSTNVRSCVRRKSAECRWPRIVSSSAAIGIEMGCVMNSSTLTSGAKNAPIARPYVVHSACGMISPNSRTTVTDSTTEVTGSVMRSSTSGSDSAAIAFHTTNVTKSLCGLLMICRTLSACFLSRDLPLVIRISISTSSRDISPSVNPDIIPAVNTSPRADNRNTRYSASVRSSASCLSVGRMA
mmetsp:Transcript_9247/g.24951  ORF Transcript_9247/g.24951 Transcript_9247/m.24951 type:complete len:231 (-) Transcript_9247:119-811(-)